MDRTTRGRRFVDAYLVATYTLLIGMAVPPLRPYHDVRPQPFDITDGFDNVIVPKGTVMSFTEVHADGGQRILPALLTVLLLPLLRRRPLLVAGCLGLAELWTGSVYAPADARYFMSVAADLAVMNVAYRWPRRTSLKAAGLVLAGAAASVAAFPPGSSSMLPNHLVVITLLVLVAWLIGSSVRERRASAARQRADAAAQAVANERLRIARELHDMIAHSIGIIAIQAGMGNRVIATQPGEARKALQAIEETSRDTLSQLRRTLTALRHGDGAGTPTGLAVGTDPAPGLADLDKLVASTRHAGVLATVESTGLSRPLPGEVDLAAYRIIQESVTNVVRHSGARTCRVTVAYGEGDVTITVADNGHGVLGTGGTGFGLVGMRERVSLVHGEFSAGPQPGGGFLVRAKLPVPGGFGTVYTSGSSSGDTAEADAETRPDAEPEPDFELDPAHAGIAPQDPDRDKSLPDAAPASRAPHPNPAVTP